MIRLAVSTFVLVGLVWPMVARADVLVDFERAQAAYEAQSYEDAAATFERIVQEHPVDSVGTALVLESRKYLAASYLFLGRSDDALRQFELLLRQDPTYELDPIRFPREVLELFERVRTRLRDEAEAARRAAQAAVDARTRDLAERQARDRRRLEALLELAAFEREVEPRSRWVAAVPFGVGQFQNDRRGLGMFFASLEATLLTASIVSGAVHLSLRDGRARQDVDFERIERVTRRLNWTTTTLFFATAVAGVLEAQIRFAPPRVRTRPRDLPPELLGGPTPHVGIGLGSFELEIRF